MISRHDFVKFALASLTSKGLLSPEEIERDLKPLLSLAPHLDGERISILDEILTAVVTEIGRAECLIDDGIDRWLKPESQKDWIHWPWLRLYLAAETNRPVKVIAELDESTNDVIDFLGDPKREGIWDRRGLVVGHVQSGKTQHYTAVVAKALDAGYKVVIILSGIHENLRQQTQERVEEVVIGKDSRKDFAYCGIRSWSNNRLSRARIPDDPVTAIPNITTLTSIAGDYGATVNRHLHVSPGKDPVILVVKKNASILKNLLKWVTNAEDGAPLSVPTLVIDDEADHSSINTAETDPETDPTKINRLIRQILWRCNRVGFVGYTATPYANIFMDPTEVEKRWDRDLSSVGSDIFPKSFIISLKAPTNYIGPEEVFGRDGDETLNIPSMAPLPMHCDVKDAENWLAPRHKKDEIVSPELPVSLREALRVFLLSVAARLALGHMGEHMSMLVHVSRFNSIQEQVARHVENELSSLVERLRHGAEAETEWVELKCLWDKVFLSHYPSFRAHPSQQVVKPVLPEWKEVRANTLAAFERMKFRNINSTTKENLDYAGARDGLIVVAVGGDRLSRGLTLAGLSISYFLRGARAFDTLMQMGRWFGYRPGYAHLCRVYAPKVIVTNFQKISLSTEELRREFTRMTYLRKKPTEYGLRVREPRIDMLVTAMNKMRRGETVRVHFSDSLVSSLDIPKSVVGKNYDAFVSLIDQLEAKHGVPNGAWEMVSGKKGSFHYRWHEASADVVKCFLKSYRATNNVCFDDASGVSMISKFIETMNGSGELENWTIALVCSSEAKQKAIPGRIYQTLNRNLDATKTASRPDHYGFKGVAMGEDEAIDISLDGYARAEELVRATGDKRSRAGFLRMQRPSMHGLLLLYPIAPVENKQPVPVEQPVIGVAVSFPSSTKDFGQDYVCNPRMLAELFGEQFVQDAERDNAEDREASKPCP